MKTLIVYDSVHGNTEKIARAIGDAIADEVKVLHAGEVSSSELETFDLIIVSSPTHGGGPTQAIKDFLDEAPAPVLKNTSVAAFDTRFSTILVRIFGFAADKIAGSLKRKGGILVMSPEGFFVKGREGPLKEGEVERTASWAKEVVKSTQ